MCISRCRWWMPWCRASTCPRCTSRMPTLTPHHTTSRTRKNPPGNTTLRQTMTTIQQPRCSMTGIYLGIIHTRTCFTWGEKECFQQAHPKVLSALIAAPGSAGTDRGWGKIQVGVSKGTRRAAQSARGGVKSRAARIARCPWVRIRVRGAGWAWHAVRKARVGDGARGADIALACQSTQGNHAQEIIAAWILRFAHEGFRDENDMACAGAMPLLLGSTDV